MSHRFRFIGNRVDAKTWCIAGDEHTHLAKVLRLQVGAEVEVMSDSNSPEHTSGEWCIGTINEITSSKAIVNVSEAKFDPPRPTKLVVALGALGHGEVDEVVAPLVELGVDEIFIFGQDDQGKNRINEKAADRWQRMIIGACKQCKRAFFPKLTILKNCDELAALSVDWPTKLVGAAEGTATVGSAPLTSGRVAIAIGSEKGLSPREADLLQTAGFLPVRLGSHVLRAKTAAIACAAVLADRLTIGPTD